MHNLPGFEHVNAALVNIISSQNIFEIELFSCTSLAILK